MDVLLKNGLVVDGSNQKPKIQDCLIKGNSIEEVGENLVVDGVPIIDCTGLVIAPGFIDAHSHNDFFLGIKKRSALEPFLKQGITTQVVGNCGFSAYAIPEDSEYKELVGGGLFKTEKPMSLQRFQKEVEGTLLCNMVPLVGHGTTRIATSGYAPGKLSKEQLELEMQFTKQAMEEGAFGGSLGLMYEPGIYADLEELTAFAKVVAAHEGILTVHPRASSKVALGYPLFGKPHIEIALDEVLTIMKASNVRTEYSHLIFVGEASWKCVDPMLEKFHQARDEGYEIGFDLYPYSFGASVITVILPAWYMGLSKEKRKGKWNRFKLHMMISITKKLLGIDFSDMVISYIGKEYPQYEGKNVAEIATMEGTSPFDMYLHLVDISEGKGRIMFGKYSNEAILERLMKDDLSIYMTDAWFEHSGTQNMAAYQSFPTFLLKSQEIGMSIEETIHKMTGKTAERYRIEKRGFIRPGFYADIAVFNPETLSVDASIPDQSPLGIEHVFVNGVLMYTNQEVQKQSAGMFLLKK